jgi:hypothetical protein
MEYDVKLSHAMFRVPVLWGATVLASQGGSYYARGCAVVNVFMDIITMGSYGVSVSSITRKILLSLIFMCIPSVWALCML